MDAQIRRLIDTAAVCDTLYQFAAGIDQRNWTLYRSVFTDEIELDYSSYRTENIGLLTADAWVERARRLFTGLDASQHSLFNPRVTIAGAKGRYACDSSQPGAAGRDGRQRRAACAARLCRPVRAVRA